MSSDSLHFRDGKTQHQVIGKRGTAMGVCATFSEQYLCCRVHVLGSVENCPFECTYCFLQNYLTDGTTKVIGDIDTLMQEVKETISCQPERLFRIGTWELGDSLALEDSTGQAVQLIQAFAGLDNAVLELKTKSDCVDALLECDHQGKTVVSWSLNPEYVIRREEHRTASLERRLQAMKKVHDAGYLMGLHFDPMIYHDGWEEGYAGLVENIFSRVTPERVAWISMGSLRFNPEMKKKIENNYPDSRLTCEEMVLGDDAKMRYVKPLRLNMYNHLCRQLQSIVTDQTLVYLCMERWDVWEKVIGSYPESVEHLDYLFARSLYDRYALGPGEPERTHYENG